MKLQAESGDNKHQIEIQRDGKKLFANIGGREYELEVSQPEPNVYLFKHEGRVFEAVVSPTAETMSKQVIVGGSEFEIRLSDPKRLRGNTAAGAHADGAAEIKTAMPGKIVRILVQAGAEIRKGDAVLVVEAMKMQNELKSPKTGVVKEIRVEEGSTVAAGDVLAIVE